MNLETFQQKHDRLEQLQAKINDMSVGERYSQAGQSLLDEWEKLLDELRASSYPINLNFW
jgi:hypothetical protein